jgi:hypothetical protein
MRRLSFLSITCAALIAPAEAIAAPSPTLTCTFSAATEALDSYTRIPAAIHGIVGAMAERDQPFQVTDVIMPGVQNPSRRLIRGGRRGNKWFVLYEQGGIAYSWQIVVFEVRPNGEGRVLLKGSVPVQWTNDQWMPKGDVCKGIDQALGT